MKTEIIINSLGLRSYLYNVLAEVRKTNWDELIFTCVHDHLTVLVGHKVYRIPINYSYGGLFIIMPDQLKKVHKILTLLSEQPVKFGFDESKVTLSLVI